jgi:hypothetical protein
MQGVKSLDRFYVVFYGIGGGRQPPRDCQVKDDFPRAGMIRILKKVVSELDWIARGEFLSE